MDNTGIEYHGTIYVNGLVEVHVYDGGRVEVYQFGDRVHPCDFKAGRLLEEHLGTWEGWEDVQMIFQYIDLTPRVTVDDDDVVRIYIGSDRRTVFDGGTLRVCIEYLEKAGQSIYNLVMAYYEQLAM
jgi:hypothetical protein